MADAPPSVERAALVAMLARCYGIAVEGCRAHCTPEQRAGIDATPSPEDPPR